MMRKFAVFSLLTMIALLMSACGGDTATPTAVTPPTTAPAGQAAQPTTPPAASGDKVTLTIESWRNDDLPIWSDKIIPAFEAKNPNIKVVFAPTAPTEYNAALNTKLAGRHRRRPDHLPALRRLARALPARAT